MKRNRWEKLVPGVAVHIAWIDSRGCPQGWEPLDEARQAAGVVISTCGWVVARSEEQVSVAAHVAIDGSGVMGMAVIPRVAVISGRVIFRP